MDKLWAPWRGTYVQSLEQKSDTGCIFCEKPRQSTDRDNLILWRGEHAFVIMNKFPYNNGHLMIVPYCHTCAIETLDPIISTEMWQLMVTCSHALNTALNPNGINIGMNIGRAAGAGIDQHIHLHMVPRWNGDTNFMSTVCETKVISQSLFDAYDCLKKQFGPERDRSGG